MYLKWQALYCRPSEKTDSSAEIVRHLMTIQCRSELGLHNVIPSKYRQNNYSRSKKNSTDGIADLL